MMAASMTTTNHTPSALAHKYASQLVILSDLFADWTQVDLIDLLQDIGGDLDIAISRITGGHAQKWDQVKGEKTTSGTSDTHKRLSGKDAKGRGQHHSGRGGRGGGVSGGGPRMGRGGGVGRSFVPPPPAAATASSRSNAAASDSTSSSPSNPTESHPNITTSHKSSKPHPSKAWADVSMGPSSSTTTSETTAPVEVNAPSKKYTPLGSWTSADSSSTLPATPQTYGKKVPTAGVSWTSVVKGPVEVAQPIKPKTRQPPIIKEQPQTPAAALVDPSDAIVVSSPIHALETKPPGLSKSLEPSPIQSPIRPMAVMNPLESLAAQSTPPSVNLAVGGGKASASPKLNAAAASSPKQSASVAPPVGLSAVNPVSYRKQLKQDVAVVMPGNVSVGGLSSMEVQFGSLQLGTGSTMTFGNVSSANPSSAPLTASPKPSVDPSLTRSPKESLTAPPGIAPQVQPTQAPQAMPSAVNGGLQPPAGLGTAYGQNQSFGMGITYGAPMTQSADYYAERNAALGGYYDNAASYSSQAMGNKFSADGSLASVSNGPGVPQQQQPNYHMQYAYYPPHYYPYAPSYQSPQYAPAPQYVNKGVYSAYNQTAGVVSSATAGSATLPAASQGGAAAAKGSQVVNGMPSTMPYGNAAAYQNPHLGYSQQQHQAPHMSQYHHHAGYGGASGKDYNTKKYNNHNNPYHYHSQSASANGPSSQNASVDASVSTSANSTAPSSGPTSNAPNAGIAAVSANTTAANNGAAAAYYNGSMMQQQMGYMTQQQGQQQYPNAGGYAAQGQSQQQQGYWPGRS